MLKPCPIHKIPPKGSRAHDRTWSIWCPYYPCNYVNKPTQKEAIELWNSMIKSELD